MNSRPAAQEPVPHEAFHLGEVPGRDKVHLRREPNLMHAKRRVDSLRLEALGGNNESEDDTPVTDTSAL